MYGLCKKSALFLAPEKAGVGQSFKIFPPAWCLGPPRTQGLRSKSALFWAPQNIGVRQPLLIFFPRLPLGTPENAGVT